VVAVVAVVTVLLALFADLQCQGPIGGDGGGDLAVGDGGPTGTGDVVVGGVGPCGLGGQFPGAAGSVEGAHAPLAPVEGHPVATVRATVGQGRAGDRVAEGDHPADGLVTVFTDPVRTGAVGVLGDPSGGVAFGLTDAGRAFGV